MLVLDVCWVWQEGLRTLVVAVAVLEDGLYSHWCSKYEAASTDLKEINKRVST